ncbi:hypothetical protein [Synechococcus sp. PCC 7335]|uniref:hypothetical protein n=1 Tax=Synechococcus sp. (strain ATCC 29403 / PCC 7335) TaxID=91464 RepID=UPI0012F9E945|nr:hypothetical protein [Synechococcus sp. PCC 7335]
MTFDIASKVARELRFYERLSEKSTSPSTTSWKCHDRWSLSPGELLRETYRG